MGSSKSPNIPQPPPPPMLDDDFEDDDISDAARLARRRRKKRRTLASLRLDGISPMRLDATPRGDYTPPRRSTGDGLRL